MVKYQVFYRLDNLQIDAVYQDCTTRSIKYKDALVYGEVNVIDPPYEVGRDYRVVLDPDGEVVDTEYNVNPVQPAPPIFELPNPFHGTVIGGDPTALKPLHVERTIDGETRDYWTYVTEDIKDLYAAGTLNIGDVVIVIFVDGDLDKPLTTQKVYKSW